MSSSLKSNQPKARWAGLAAIGLLLAGAGGGSVKAETVTGVTQYSYDAAGRPICATVRMNSATFASPPASACALGTAGADGPDRITFTEYDAADRVTKITSGYGSDPRVEKAVTYTDNGKEATLADGKGNLTTYAYDGFDRLAKVSYPSPSTAGTSSTTDYEQYGYDAADNRTSLRRRDGQVVSFVYDALSRTTSKSLPSTTYTYDNLGRQLSATSGDQVISNTYDALGRTTSEYGAYGTFGFQYDLAGTRTRITWPDGFYAAYDHDVTGAVTAIRENGAASGLGVLATYSYDDLGRRTSVLRGNGNQTTYGYDAASRLASLGIDLGGTTYDQTYGFAYTADSQVKTRSVANVGYDWPYAYTSRAYTANGLNQLTTAGALSLSYDGRGNLTSDGATTYTYDVENHLTASSSGAALRYDPTGRLMETRTLSTAATWFRYAGADLVAEYDSGGSGALLRRYVPGPGGDEPVIWYEGSGSGDRRWLFADAQGSIVAASNNAGSAILINLYDEYGAPGPSNIGRFQYTGQTWIPELGFYHYKARVYSPTLGRFLQTDPIGYKDGLNWYSYVDNDPLNRTDPTGNDGVAAGAAIGCAVTAEVGCVGGAAVGAGVGLVIDVVGGTALGVGVVALVDKFVHRNDGVKIDETGTVHGDLPSADAVPDGAVEDSIKALETSIEKRKEAIRSHPAGNPNGSARERRQAKQKEQHEERVRREERLRDELKERSN